MRRRLHIFNVVLANSNSPFKGGTGLSYVFQASPDLATWSALTTYIVRFDFIDTVAGNQAIRIYRRLFP